MKTLLAFFYDHLKPYVLKGQRYDIASILLFFLVAHLFEGYLQGGDSANSFQVAYTIFAVINLAFALWQLFKVLNYGIDSARPGCVRKRFWDIPITWVLIPALCSFLNVIYCLLVLAAKEDTIVIHDVGAFLSVLYFAKMLKYLQFVDGVAPRVRILFLILSEIRFFVVLLIIYVFGFGHAFYFLGKN